MNVHEAKRLAEFLDCLTGGSEGKAILGRLLDKGQDPKAVVRDIGLTEGFRRTYKEAYTKDIMRDGGIEADPGFVGLPGLDQGKPFAAQFAQDFAPRLGKRADGFRTVFDRLADVQARPLVIETGCLRIPGNWDGDGQSTFMFDALARGTGGSFFSIDITAESLDTARQACSSAANLILNDSVAALHALSSTCRGPAGLLYLDSFDLDPRDPMPSAIHHVLELAAARPLMGSGTIVCIDDYCVGDTVGGKGLLVDRFMGRIRAECIHSGYQKVWQIR